MAQAMVRIAFELFAVSRMDIHCDPENAASEKVARRLGFAFEGRLRDMQLEPHHERGDLLRFTLTASEYPQTAAAELPIEAFDFLDRPIVLPKTS
jgi:RimJ/RimL family protein N-acetyltransferase